MRACARTLDAGHDGRPQEPVAQGLLERLVAAGKLKKVALVAAMRKLAHAIYSVAKNRRPFVPRLAAVSEAA